MANTEQNNTAAQPTGAPGLDVERTLMDVHDDYMWTLSSKASRKYVPRVILTEYQLTQSSEIGSLKQTATSITESPFAAGVTIAGTSVGKLKEAADRVTKAAGTTTPVTRRQYGIEALKGIFSAGAQVAGLEAFSSLYAKLDKYDPYKGLYPSRATGREYILPYLDVNNMAGINNSWAPIDEASLGNSLATISKSFGLGDVLKGTKDSPSVIELAKQATQLTLLYSNPGTAVEKIKKFTPADSGNTIDVVFYLFNTEDAEDIAMNWEFLYTLTYQNLPNRRSTNLLDPPCVYSVEIPGYRYFPVAVIEKLTVTNEGTTRLVDIDTGTMVTAQMAESSKARRIKLIPEVFKVALTIRSLLTETQNIYSYGFDGNKRVVNVFTQSGAVSLGDDVEQGQGGPTTGQTRVSRLNPERLNTPEENELIRRSRGFGR